MNESTANGAGFSIEPCGSGVVAVTASGEIDLAVAPQLRAALDAALADLPGALLIDLSAVEFVDSAVLGELARAAEHADTLGTRLAVIADHHAVTRPITLVGLDRRIPLRSTRAEALADFA